MRIGIVDLGTNSVRFAIYQTAMRGPARCLYKKKLMIRPGQGVFATGHIHPKTSKRLIREFRWFAKKAKALGATQCEAVATSAFRDAKNGRAIAKEIFKKSGVRVKIISGRQEARLIALGVLTHDSMARGSCALIDIGGGSTEISWCRKQKPFRSSSLALGALRLQQVYLPPEKQRDIKEKLAAVVQMRRAISLELRRHHLPPTQARNIKLAIGSSGTIRAVARLIDRRHAQSLKIFSKKAAGKAKPRLQFSKESLSRLIETMLPLTRAELGRLPGMEKKRLDNILGGAILLHELVDRLGIETIKTTNYSLRDGLIQTISKRSVRVK